MANGRVRSAVAAVGENLRPPAWLNLSVRHPFSVSVHFDSFAAELAQAHASVPDALPGAAFCGLADGLLALLFPYRAERPLPNVDVVAAELYHFRSELAALLANVPHLPAPAAALADEFTAQLPALRAALLRDATAILASDPAAQGLAEIIGSYPGFYATALYRIAHALYERGLPRLPRLLSEHAHQRTGIDIHPGAHIGPAFCIDHGTGLVIGETAIIGANVQIYQGVTLGAMSVTKGLQGQKRHPTIEDHVVIYAGATILGGSTVVGAHSVIGGNVWLTESVPSHSRVYHRAHINISRSVDPAAELVFSI
jgi:serine O-acetyltransferase